MAENDCDVCSRLQQLFSATRDEKPIDLGDWDEALKSPCPDLTEIIKAFRAHTEGRGLDISSETSDVGFLPREGDSVTLTQSVTKLGACWELLLVQNDEQPDHPGTGRLLNPDWVDLQIANVWKKTCLEEHGSKCSNPMKIAPTTPALLVDVENQCVVPGAAGMPYIALSYRWGDAVGFRLDANILDRVKVPGALQAEDIVKKKPAMIQHAMRMTSLLNERYLWVDAFCILHGGHASTAAQINAMSAIYTHAVFTIIAADGISTDGLLGIKDVSPPRKYEQRIFKLGKDKLMLRNSSIFSLTNYGEYHDRSWTYQEFVQSPRKLLFHSKELHWQCQCRVWHEEINMNAEISGYIDPRPAVISAGFPDLDSLAHSLSNYNKRNLTYDEDALSGTAGLLSVHSRTFEGGFLFGCPEMFFDHALAWSPYWSLTNMRRRVASSRPPETQLSASPALPSWSWLGWQGIFSLHYGEAARINDRQFSMVETVPITDWYTSSEVDGARRKIRSTWFENRDAYKDLNTPLPEGWTRHKSTEIETFRGEPRLYPDGCDGSSVFSHNAMPDEDCKYWYYPFPVAKIEVTTPTFTPEQTQYLFCDTEKATLFSHRADYEDIFKGKHVLKLRKGAGSAIVGTLHLHNDEQWQLWPEVEKDDQLPQGLEVELVAISRKITYKKTFNEELQRYNHPLLRQEHYNVLWLEWADGVAYRKAVGQVERTTWEGMQRQKIELILG